MDIQETQFNFAYFSVFKAITLINKIVYLFVK